MVMELEMELGLPQLRELEPQTHQYQPRYQRYGVSRVDRYLLGRWRYSLHLGLGCWVKGHGLELCRHCWQGAQVGD